MALSFTNAGASAAPDLGSTANTQTYASAAWTPATHDLVLLAVAISHTTANNGTNPTCSGNGLTWVSIAHFSDIATTTTCVLFAADNSAGGATNGATTVDMGAGNNGTGCELLFCYVDGVDLSGGVAAAFVQAVTNSGTTTSASITLSAAGNSNNRPFAHFAIGANLGISPRTNWTELDEMSHTTPNRHTASQYRSDAFETTASATWGGSSQVWAGIAVEIKAASSGPQTVSPGLINQSATIFAPKVNQQVAPALINQSATIFAPQVNLKVSLGLIDQSASIFGPTVQPGGISAQPGLIDRSAVIFAPQANLSVAMALIDQSATIFAPQVNQSLSPPLIDQSAVAFAPTVSTVGGPQTVSPGLIDQSAVIFAPKVNLSMALALIDQSAVIFSPQANLSGSVGLIDQSAQIFAPSVRQSVALPLLDQSAVVFQPGIALRVDPPLIDQSATVFAPTITGGGAPGAPPPGNVVRLRRKRWVVQ